MTQTEARLKEVHQYFDNDDYLPGFRKLLDCVADTQNMTLYNEAIQLTSLKEEQPENTNLLKERSKEILEKIARIPVKEYQLSSPIVSGDGIRKSYGVGKFSLGPVSLSINKGQVYGLVGENGNGKTTLLRILAKDISYDGGSLSYHFDDKPSNEFDMRSKLVYIPQRTAKWYGSLRDNLKLVLTHYGCAPQENESRILLMIARLGLWKYKELKWRELSSGYKMRFELARTLLRKPELLLLDEPLANLDIVSQQLILEDLKSIANSVNNPIALILSSQQLYEVEKISDKVIFLRDGKYIDNNNSEQKEIVNELVVEIDCLNNREELQAILSSVGLNKLVYNGGVYVAHLNASASFAQVLEALGKGNMNITYIRNISTSTRRFFVS